MLIEQAIKNIKYLKQLSSSYFLMATNYIIFFFLTPLMLNKLGNEQYGIWLLLSNIIMYFTLSNFGIAPAFTIELPKVRKDKLATDKLLNTVLLSLILAAVLTSLIFIVLEFYLQEIFSINTNILNTTRITFLFFYLTFTVNIIGSLFDNILISSNEIIKKNAIEILKISITGGISILLVLNEWSLIHIAGSNFLIGLVFFFVTFYTCKKVIRFKINLSLFDFELFKKLINPSWYFFVISIVGLVVFYSDNLLISKLKGVEYVGLYAITYRISDVCLKIITKISNTKYPKVIQLSADKKYPELLKLHNKLFLLNLITAVPICSILFFFGKDIIQLWLGSNHDINEGILRIFSIFTLSMILAQNTGMFVIGLGIHQRFAYMGVAEATLNLLLSYLFFQYFDLLGIALGTLTAHLLTNGWFAYFEFFRFIRTQKYNSLT